MYDANVVTVVRTKSWTTVFLIWKLSVNNMYAYYTKYNLLSMCTF